MRFAVAVVSAHHGDAFREVAEALHHGLLALGHDSVLTTRLDLHERMTIVLNPCFITGSGLEPPKKAILYNLEQVDRHSGWMTPELLALFKRYPVWDYSQTNIERLVAWGVSRPTHVPIGYVPELTRISPAAEDVDVLFYGTDNARRHAVLEDLRARGLRVKWLFGAYGASRDAWIARSKVVLNIHFYESQVFEIVRVSYLLANRRAVVCERGADPTAERDLESGVAFAAYDELVDRCVELLGDERARRELAERGYQAFRVRSQAAILHSALSADHAGVPDETAAIEGRHLDAPGPDPQEHARDLLLAEVERNPQDARSAFFLAESYFCLGDFVNARKWYARRAEMGGCDEEVYFAMYRIAVTMAELGAPWQDVQEAYLRAWDFRPTRAEPLYAITLRYRVDQRYRLGYLFAKSAAEIPFPEEDTIFFAPDVYSWIAADEQAVCASWIDKHAEAFTLWRRLLARPDVPDEDRLRIAGNRDVCVPTMLKVASAYPDLLVQRLRTSPGDTEVVVSLVAGPDRDSTEQMLNSFLNCCLDVGRVGRFLALDAGLSAADRVMLGQRYGFLEFADRCSADEPSTQLAHIRTQIDARFWLHLGQAWRFFAPENFITRLTAVLEAEPQVFQVAINFTDAVRLIGACAAEEAVRRTPDAGRYLLIDVVASGPAMFDTARLDRADALGGTDFDPLAELGRRATAAGLRTATLDEVLCISDP